MTIIYDISGYICEKCGSSAAQMDRYRPAIPESHPNYKVTTRMTCLSCGHYTEQEISK